MRSSALSPRDLKTQIEAIDAEFDVAGLVHSRRSLGRARRAKILPAAANELTKPAPDPEIAANGVCWLPVPGWRLPWLWSGFSTRKGGVSRVYCGDDAEGELNLGLTDADAREAVLRNRQLLAEAVTGEAQT